jgi:GH24 family phage-related lysozyme (muramidase)
MTEILQNLLSKSDLLIVFLGMFALVWKALSIAHDLSRTALATRQIWPDVPPTEPPPPPPPIATKPAPPVAPPAPPVVIDPGLIAFVKQQEGFVAKAQWDYKQYTNGYGTRAASATEVVTQAVAEQRLQDELGKALTAVKAFVPANTPIGVEQGLTSATFNLGTQWMGAGLGAAVKAGDWKAAGEHLLQYNHAGGQVLPDLTKRRQAEVNMFDHPV